jgi:hypothetical protein
VRERETREGRENGGGSLNFFFLELINHKARVKV